MTKSEFAITMDRIFDECRKFTDAGQKEYAHKETEAFANFDRVAERMNLSREQVLMVYAEKHLDGIHSFIQGHRSQREDVRGRINDAIVYLCLLRGMLDDAKLVNISYEEKEPIKVYPKGKYDEASKTKSST